MPLSAISPLTILIRSNRFSLPLFAASLPCAETNTPHRADNEVEIAYVADWQPESR
ncbi:MAG TPA: hypothetical protein V6D10_17485 [Trichocoleus sp.]